MVLGCFGGALVLSLGHRQEKKRMLTKILNLFGLRRRLYEISGVLLNGNPRDYDGIQRYKIKRDYIIAYKGSVIVLPFAAYRSITIRGGGIARKIVFPKQDKDSRVQGSF